MPKVTCNCGHIMNLSTGYQSYELILVPESRIEEIGEKLDKFKHLNTEDFYDLIDEVRTAVYRCPSCVEDFTLIGVTGFLPLLLMNQKLPHVLSCPPWTQLKTPKHSQNQHSLNFLIAKSAINF